MRAEGKKRDFNEAFNEDPAQHSAASNPPQNYIELNNFDGRPSSGDPEILLHTTEANLIQFRHRGFLAGDTLIAKAVYELGQYRKRTFIDQKFDIDGHATKPATDVAADEDSMFAGIQNLLDQLGRLEKFIHAKPSPENRQSLEEAYHRYRGTLVQHFNARPSSHADRIASGLLSLPAHQTDFSHDAIVGAALSANGDDSLGEKIRRETLRLLSALNTYQFLYTRETGHIASGFANTCIKKAISSVNNHSFALSTQAKFKRDLLPDLASSSRGLSTPRLTPELTTIREETRELTREDSRLSVSSFKESTEESFEAKAEASRPPEVTVNNHSLNHDRVRPAHNLSPSITVSVEHYMKKTEIKTLEHFQRFANYLNKGEEARPALPLSQFKSFLKAPVLWWRRRSGVDHPSNHSAGFKYIGLVLIKIFAVLADNICGLFTGLVQKNFNFFRKKATRIQFPHQPQDPSVLLEWRIRTKIAPGRTLLNQASQLFSETIGQIGSSVIYSLKAISEGLITLFTDNYVVQKCRGILRAPQSEQTRLLNILRTLNSNTQKNSTVTMSPADLEREAHAPNVIRLNKPSDSYRSTDLLGVVSETVDLGMLGFSNFALEHPSLSFLIATSFSLAALPTAVKAALNTAIQAINTPLIAEQISGILPAGKAQLALQSFLNNYLFSKLRLTDAVAISTFDVDEFIRHMTSLDAPKFQTNLNLKTLQQKGQAAATAQPQTPEPSSDESMKPLLKKARGLRNLKIPSPLPSPAPEPTLRDILDPTLLALLANFNQLPLLSQIKKNDLARYVLKTYSHENQKPLVDLILQQCLKTAPIRVKNFTLPQSALSKSLVHAIQHVFSFVNMVFSIPRVFIDLARRHQSSLSNLRCSLSTPSLASGVLSERSLLESVAYSLPCLKFLQEPSTSSSRLDDF